MIKYKCWWTVNPIYCSSTVSACSPLNTSHPPVDAILPRPPRSPPPRRRPHGSLPPILRLPVCIFFVCVLLWDVSTPLTYLFPRQWLGSGCLIMGHRLSTFSATLLASSSLRHVPKLKFLLLTGFPSLSRSYACMCCKTESQPWHRVV